MWENQKEEEVDVAEDSEEMSSQTKKAIAMSLGNVLDGFMETSNPQFPRNISKNDSALNFFWIII